VEKQLGPGPAAMDSPRKGSGEAQYTKQSTNILVIFEKELS
jgi:hypothetical protein